MKILVTGHTGNDVTLQRIMDFLKQDAEAMTGRAKADNTKPIYIKIDVGEGEPVNDCGGDCTCNTTEVIGNVYDHVSCLSSILLDAEIEYITNKL